MHKKSRPSNNVNSNTSVVFKSWSDSDFYSNKATHLFFYGKVDANKVQILRKELYDASKVTKTNSGVNVKPRPIVIHVHSPGGNGELGITMANFLREVPVPIAVVVDGYACSAATPLLVAASYRVLHEFSFVMFHEGSIVFNDGLWRDSEAKHYIKDYMGTIDDVYKKFYTDNTKVPKDVLENMLSRDIFMNAKTCLKYKVVDRIIPINKISSFKRWGSYMSQYPDLRLTNDPKSWKVTLNHLFNYDNTKVGEIEALLDVIKPMQAVMTEKSSNLPTPIVLHSNHYMAPRPYLFDVSTIMIHVNLMRVPVIGVIDSNVDLLQALPCIMAWKTYMYDNTFLDISLVYNHRDLPMYYYDDIKHNTEMIRVALIKILRQYTKMPESVLTTLFDKRQTLSAKLCKEYGLVDDIVSSISRVNIKGGCSCSQGLAYDFRMP